MTKKISRAEKRRIREADEIIRRLKAPPKTRGEILEDQMAEAMAEEIAKEIDAELLAKLKGIVNEKTILHGLRVIRSPIHSPTTGLE